MDLRYRLLLTNTRNVTIVTTLLAGLFMATAFSILVLILALLRRSWYFDTYGMSAAQIIAGYYGAAVIGGITAGLLWPLTRWKLGSFVVGTVVGFIFYDCLGFLMYGWGSHLLWVGGIAGVIVGGGLGVVFHDQAS
jgi:hypothetical protein